LAPKFRAKNARETLMKMTAGCFASVEKCFCKITVVQLKANFFFCSGTNHNVAFSNRPPSLGHLLMMIRHLADHLLTSEDNLKFSREKLMSINVLGLAELAVYLPTNVADKLSTSGNFGRAKKKFPTCSIHVLQFSAWLFSLDSKRVSEISFFHFRSSSFGIE